MGGTVALRSINIFFRRATDLQLIKILIDWRATVPPTEKSYLLCTKMCGQFFIYFPIFSHSWPKRMASKVLTTVAN